MAHSEDLRRRVIKFIRQGGSKAEAMRRFDVARSCIFRWLKLSDEELAGKKPGPKGAHKVDIAALQELLRKRNDLMLKEVARILKVHESTISKALKRIGISRKKNGGLRRGQAL
jgi:transposase